jgi:hypothetical protein
LQCTTAARIVTNAVAKKLQTGIQAGLAADKGSILPEWQ